MILAPGQSIPHGRPYRYHLNGPIHMMTARKRVGPVPTHRLAVRHSADHSSSDSSSEASSDFHSDASSDSSLRHSLPDHSSPDLPSTSAGPSRKRRRSPRTSVPALPLISGALSPAHTALIPSPKRVRDFGYLADAEIDECFAYADALRDRGIDARVVVEAVDREESEISVRGPIEVRVERVMHPEMPEDIPEPVQEGAVEVTYETLGDLVQRFHDHTEAIPIQQGHRIVGVESAVTALTERIAELERDNRRLRGTASVESQRVDRLQRGMSRMQRELRQIRRKMPNTRSGASMTHEEVEELVTRRVAEEMEAREAAMNLEPLNENRDEQEGRNRGNGNRGNRGNGNGGNEGNGNGGLKVGKASEVPFVANDVTYKWGYYLTDEIYPEWAAPASDTESDPSEDPSSDHIPSLPAISPFLSSTNNTTDGDTPDTPPSPTHGTPFTEITSSTHRSHVIPRRQVIILAPGQPIPYG
ncbi:reverse transcriptase domain-containing protein [Tanacetum coccineum]